MTPLLPEWILFSTLIHLYFVLITTAAILTATLPFLRNTVLDYGKLNEKTDKAASAQQSRQQKQQHPTKQSSTERLILFLRSLTVPKRWFAHFYVWATLWMLYLTADLYQYTTSIASSSKPETLSDRPWSFLLLLKHFGVSIDQAANRYHHPLAPATSEHAVPWLLLGLYLLHVIRRWYESWYVERPSPTARMHAGHYLVGISFYTAVPPALWIDAVEHPDRVLSTVQLTSMRWAVMGTGTILFLWASYHQNVCHRILANLRGPKAKSTPLSKQDYAVAKKNDNGDLSSSVTEVAAASKSAYKVPHGDWFAYFVCPHYVAEMLIYFAFYLIASATLKSTSSALSFNHSLVLHGSATLFITWIWVVVNLGIVARETKAWYRVTFGDQWTSRDNPVAASLPGSAPASRRWILIPFVY